MTILLIFLGSLALVGVNFLFQSGLLHGNMPSFARSMVGVITLCWGVLAMPLSFLATVTFMFSRTPDGKRRTDTAFTTATVLCASLVIIGISGMGAALATPEISPHPENLQTNATSSQVSDTSSEEFQVTGQQNLYDVTSLPDRASSVEDGYKTYESSSLSLWFVYPEQFSLFERPGDVSTGLLGSVQVALTQYDSERGRPIDCGGKVLQPDEVSIKISVYSRALPYMKDYNAYPSVRIGSHEMKIRRNIGGMCGDVDGYFFTRDDGTIVEAHVSPSETEYLEIAEKLLATLRYVGAGE